MMDRRNFLKIPVLGTILLSLGVITVESATPAKATKIDITSSTIIDIVERTIHHHIWEYNDAITRRNIRMCIEDEIKSLYDNLYFIVICDERNNPLSVIDSNDLVIDVYTSQVTPHGPDYLQYHFSAKDVVKKADMM